MMRTTCCVAAGITVVAIGLKSILSAGSVSLPTATAAEQPSSQKVTSSQTVMAVKEQPKRDRSGAPRFIAIESPAHVTTQPSTVEPWERTKIYAKAEGYLSEVLVDIGDRVTQGQPLARLWIPEVEQQRVQKMAMADEAHAAIAQAHSKIAAAEAETVVAIAKLEVAKATVSRQEAEVDYRRVEHERIAQLVASKAMNQAVLDEKVNSLRAAESGLDVARASIGSAEAEVLARRTYEQQAQSGLVRAQAQLKVAEAELKYAEILAAYSEIRAPYDGLITARGADTGDFVTAGSKSAEEPLFVADRDGKLRIVLDVPESQSAMVEVGQPASLVVDALRDREFNGRVARTAGVLDPRTRTLRVEVELGSPAVDLRPGMYGMTTLTLSKLKQAASPAAQSANTN